MNFLETTTYRIILKTHLFLEATGRQNSFERFPYLGILTERLTAECLEAWQHDTSAEASRYAGLLERICDETASADYSILCNALDLCLAAATVPEFAAFLNYYTGNTVTIQLASELDGVTYSSFDAIMRRLQKLQKICFVDWDKTPLPYATIEIDNVLLSYLTNSADLFPRLFPDWIECFDCDTALHPMFVRQHFAVEGADWLQRASAPLSTPADKARTNHLAANILQISGHGGRRFLARHIARLMKRDLLLIHVPECKDQFENGVDAKHFWSSLVHAAFLKNAIVCFCGITASLLSPSQIDRSAFVSTAVLPFTRAELPVILCTDADICFSSDIHLQPYLHQIQLGETTRQEREAALRGFAGLYTLPVDCARLSVQYPLSPSEIAGVVTRWRTIANTSSKDFGSICSDILYKGEEPLFGQILYPSVRLDDLILPDRTRQTLEQICCAAAEGYRILEEWNLRRLYPYGRAVTVLLYGPSGTGKTMTAHAIAGKLETALYQVDLSSVLDKYIGETEKHLEQIFAFARKTRPVLFFDEADSLFGRRGEVTDGKDRYANMEVSYILQRIEQFDGIVVLATNLYSGIDKAFLRRMKYVIKYQSPDAAMRRRIWENCLPPELPREELDLDFLSEQYDITGGLIKNIVYTACVMAVHDNKKLCMEHVLNAVCAEYEKLERPVTRDMWGRYGEI